MTAHILVVEDDEKMRQLLAAHLEYQNYRVTQAADGQEALDLLPRHAYQVVLTDIVMGSVDGLDVLYAARQQAYNPAVILLTGHGSLETAQQALRGRAYDYLLKPCSADDLLACVAGALQHQRMEHQLIDAAVNLFPGLSRAAHKEPALLEPDHPPPTTTQTVQIGLLLVGSTRYDVSFDDQHIWVTPIEYALLRYLAERVGQTCRYEEIVHHTHGLQMNAADAQVLVRPHVHNLRRKIDPRYLLTQRSVGYRLMEPNDEH